MPLKIARESIKVSRDGAPVWVPTGKPFNFTDEEVEQIEAASPTALLAVNVREAEDIVAALAADTGKPASRKSAARKSADIDDL